MFYFIEDPVVIMFMRPEKIVVSHPEVQVIVGTVDVVKAVCHSVSCLIGTVEPFDYLFELKGRYSLETASSLVSPITWVTRKVNASPNFSANSVAARG